MQTFEGHTLGGLQTKSRMGSYVLPALCKMAKALKKAHFGYFLNCFCEYMEEGNQSMHKAVMIR